MIINMNSIGRIQINREIRLDLDKVIISTEKSRSVKQLLEDNRSLQYIANLTKILIIRKL